jgi:hypothetical protein
MKSYDNMSLEERLEWHGFEERRHSEAIRHLIAGRSVLTYGSDPAPFVDAALKCNVFLFDDWQRFKDVIGGEELRRIDVAALDAEIPDAPI